MSDRLLGDKGWLLSEVLTLHKEALDMQHMKQAGLLAQLADAMRDVNRLRELLLEVRGYIESQTYVVPERYKAIMKKITEELSSKDSDNG